MDLFWVQNYLLAIETHTFGAKDGFGGGAARSKLDH